MSEMYEYRLKLLPEEEARVKEVATDLRMTIKAVLLGGVELMASHTQSDLAKNVALAVVSELTHRGMVQEAKKPVETPKMSFFDD